MRRYFSILFFVCCSYAASAQLFVAESSINLDSIETDEQGAKKLSSLLNVNHKQEFLSIINEGYVLSTIKHHFILTGKTSLDIYVISLNAQAPALLQRCYVFLSIKGKAYYTNADTILVDIASTKPVILRLARVFALRHSCQIISRFVTGIQGAEILCIFIVQQ